MLALSSSGGTTVGDVDIDFDVKEDAKAAVTRCSMSFLNHSDAVDSRLSAWTRCT